MTKLSAAVVIAVAAIGVRSPASSRAGASCIDGHPAQRPADVTYGGLPPQYGFQRDHVIPLCLGGPDTRENVQYQPWPEARAKDQFKWSICEAFCRGEISFEAARAMFAEMSLRVTRHASAAAA